MKLLKSIVFGALATAILCAFGFGAVRLINFLGGVNSMYPLVLILVGVWAFCTVIFYSGQ